MPSSSITIKMADPIRQATKAIRDAEATLKIGAGPPIEWTPEQQALREELKQELLRRVRDKEIQPLDARSPQSVTDTFLTLSDLDAKKLAALDWAHPDMNPPEYEPIPGWRGEPCRDESHRGHGTLLGHCPDCHKRLEK